MKNNKSLKGKKKAQQVQPYICAGCGCETRQSVISEYELVICSDDCKAVVEMQYGHVWNTFCLPDDRAVAVEAQTRYFPRCGMGLPVSREAYSERKGWLECFSWIKEYNERFIKGFKPHKDFHDKGEADMK